MRYIKFFFTLIALVFVYTSHAQFMQEAKITFERKTNQWKKVEANNDDDEGGDENWIKYFKQNNPQYKIDSFALNIKNNATSYSPLGEEVVERNWWSNNPASRNTVHSDYNTNMRVAQKAIFEDELLITDSVKKLNWKITNETRVIGGFECRKATAKIMDSVYVIAFYSDQIMVSGGPESFSGLPGCILVISIPRLYTTWQATSIQVKNITDKEMLFPKKGAKVNLKQLDGKLKSSIGKWGKWGQQYMHLINL